MIKYIEDGCFQLIHVKITSLKMNWLIYYYFLFPGTGSLTVLRRSNSKPKNASTSSSRTSSVVSGENESYVNVDLGVEKLPAVDTPDASHVCSLRSVTQKLITSNHHSKCIMYMYFEFKIAWKTFFCNYEKPPEKGVLFTLMTKRKDEQGTARFLSDLDRHFE